ncbi:MAG TPA: hypothetical protein VL282_03940 [Tepidisphaeraceae bacterium]|nr:hypothetical protein [Tepidisphaeraceae bacterium]
MPAFASLSSRTVLTRLSIATAAKPAISFVNQIALAKDKSRGRKLLIASTIAGC